MRIDVDAVIEPAGGELTVHAALHGVTEFFLHRQLSIDSTQGGTLMPGEATSPFVDDAVAYTVRANADGHVVISYRGALPAAMAEGTNVIDPARLELALYSAWFPVPVDMTPFTWNLHLRLPDGWTAVSNGHATEDGFASDPAPAVGDIVIAAAPWHREHQVGSVARVVELGSPSPLAERIVDLARQALDQLTGRYGPLDSIDPVSVVLTSRDGYGYSRLPAIFLAGEGSDDPTGDLHTVLHEVSHLWWNIAPAAGTDDWLNEALAEYSALWLSRNLLGDDFATHLVDGYRETAASVGSPPIRNTGPDDQDSFYANKYARGTLFFLTLEQALGEPGLASLLTTWRDQWATERSATTQSLLDAIYQLDPTIAGQADTILNTPSWTGDCQPE